MRRNLLVLLALVACGGDDKKNVDAAPPADMAVDMPAAAPDCTTYCNQIQTNCTAANAQYPDMAHCTSTCASFAVGTTGQQIGNTLGCRLYHSGTPSMTLPAMHCVHAGPGGDLVSAAAPGTCGDACTSFCTLEIKACGTTTSAPATGQYADMAACMTACGGFEKTHLYSVTPQSRGDSLACRLYHATNAAITGNAMTHCPHTAAAPAGANNPCLAGSAPSP